MPYRHGHQPRHFITPLLRLAAKSNRLKAAPQFRSGLAAAKMACYRGFPKWPATAGFTGGAIRHSICERAIRRLHYFRLHPLPRKDRLLILRARPRPVRRIQRHLRTSFSVVQATRKRYWHNTKAECANAQELLRVQFSAKHKSVSDQKKRCSDHATTNCRTLTHQANCPANPKKINARLAQEGSFSIVSCRSPLGPHRRPRGGP